MSKPIPSTRKEAAFRKRIEVRWGDMDALGHVNNARYFVFSESARIAFFEQLFADDSSFMRAQGPILAGISCDYHQQVHYPADLEVEVRIESVGSRSLVMNCPVFRCGETQAVADMRATIVWFSYAEQTTMPVPSRLRKLAEISEKHP